MRLIHLSLGVFLLAVACAKSTPEVKEAPRGIGITTVLIEPGSEPREKIRYTRAPDLSEDLVVEFGLATLFESSSQVALVQNPVLTLGMRVKTAKCESDVCSYPFEFRVIGVKMPEGSTEAQADEVMAMVAPLANVKGVFEVDERGITQKADVTWPTNVSPRLLTLLGNVRTSLISVPLPEEPIGIGARWKVERLHDVGTIKTVQTVSYSLLERKGEFLRLGVTMHQTAAPQTVAASSDTTFQLESYEVSGSGTMLMGLESLTPLSEIRATSNLRGAMVHGGQSEQLQATGALDLVVAPVATSSGQ